MPPELFYSGMELGRKATIALAFTCRDMLKKAALRRIGLCSLTGSEVFFMLINILHGQAHGGRGASGDRSGGEVHREDGEVA